MFEHEDRKPLPAWKRLALRGDADGPGTTANGGAKFGIGLLAGAAAVLVPRLLALLSKSDDAHIVFFPTSYYSSPLQEAPREQRLQVSAPVGDQANIYALARYAVHDAVGLERRLPVLADPQSE